jgi:hypothetical protein
VVEQMARRILSLALRNATDEKDQSDPPLGACQGPRPWVGVELQECDVPVLVAAKSFVLSRWPNFASAVVWIVFAIQGPWRKKMRKKGSV